MENDTDSKTKMSSNNQFNLRKNFREHVIDESCPEFCGDNALI